ncbi:MAG: hypothetical protein EOM03_03985 [Clostridia bacterium]|nr:hypothetical protein [Clostridia bacterium]NLF21116.1 hypothetical protein [Clostridiaceae bacterium]
MNIKDNLRRFFNRDVEYIDEYLEDEDDNEQVKTEEISEEEKTVIAVTLAALAAGCAKNADFRIHSIKRVR